MVVRWRGGEDDESLVGKRDIEDVILDEIDGRRRDGMKVELEGVEVRLRNQLREFGWSKRIVLIRTANESF